MVIISGKPGQLGNSLILYSNFIAFAKQYNVKIYNPSFYKYRDYFEFTSKPLSINLFIFNCLYYYTRILIKLKAKCARDLDWHEHIDLDESADEAMLKCKRYFVQGWQYRGNKVVEQYRNEIIELFTPKKFFIKNLNVFFDANFKDKTETIIGIHIRGGDYKTFENGKYFYSVAQYSEVIKRVAKLFSRTKINFLICSNETIEIKDFDPALKITKGPGHELLDMYSLSRCNYIIGPPSTYTMWASYYGNVPLYMLHEIDKDFLLNEFKIQIHF